MAYYYLFHLGTETILDADECVLLADDGPYQEGRLLKAALNHGQALPVRGVRIRLKGGLVRDVEGYDQNGKAILPVPATIWDYDTETVHDEEDLQTDEYGETYVEYGG